MDVTMRLEFDNCDDEEVDSSFHTLSSGCDVYDGGEFSGDDLVALVPPFSPRKFSRPIVRPECEISPQVTEDSPPYKKIRALRLFDSPATPKTILQKSTSVAESVNRPASRSRLFPPRQRATTVAAASSGQVTTCTPSPSQTQQKEAKGKCPTKEVANINPFTPTEMMLSSRRKRSRSKRELSHTG